MNRRVLALLDLDPSSARDGAGLHRYDGVVADLSPAGVRSLLAELGRGAREDDPHDEAVLQAAEAGARLAYGELQLHRWNPILHLNSLDLSGYDREYAPAAERAASRWRHLVAWPDAIDASLESLTEVPRPVATAVLGAARGLGADLDRIGASAGEPGAPGPDGTLVAARSALSRLVGRLEQQAEEGPEELPLGRGGLARLMGTPEGLEVDLDRLARDAAAERHRLESLLAEACERLGPGEETAAVVARVRRDHPGVAELELEARALVEEVTAFARASGLVADPGGECRVGPAPPSLRWAMAMMAWNGPYEPPAPAWFWINPPDPSFDATAREEWLAVFNRASLPAITVHEVVPGHFAHGQWLRGLRSDVRRTLLSPAFVEGWAHYAEELYLEEGFRASDPRYQVGVALEGLVRVTRLEVALGLHQGRLDLDAATRTFVEGAFLAGPAARSEASRGTFDPTYGRYTWGKMEIRRLRDDAMARWGRRYRHRRFHDALAALGAPPLGLLDDALGAP